MSGAINWQMLKNQYFSNEIFREELFNMIQSPEGVSWIIFFVKNIEFHADLGERWITYSILLLSTVIAVWLQQ